MGPSILTLRDADGAEHRLTAGLVQLKTEAQVASQPVLVRSITRSAAATYPSYRRQCIDGGSRAIASHERIPLELLEPRQGTSRLQSQRSGRAYRR
jgi:hypothetical protein